jgi:hypothetical protein
MDGKSMVFRISNIFLRSIHLDVLAVAPRRALLSFGYQNDRLANKMP